MGLLIELSYITQETLTEASQHEPVAEELKTTNEELQKTLDARPDAEQLASETTDATDGFAKSQADLSDLIKRLEDYDDVAEKFTKSYEDLAEWLPTVQQQASELKPISTQPDVVEEQIHETEVGVSTTMFPNLLKIIQFQICTGYPSDVFKFSRSRINGYQLTKIYLDCLRCNFQNTLSGEVLHCTLSCSIFSSRNYEHLCTPVSE